MRQITHIFCGNPGGGTSFTANYLTHVGFPCGHEMLGYVVSEGRWHVGPSGEAEFAGGRLIDGALGESSYIAIDWCDRDPFKQTPLVMISRNPVSVLNSHMMISMQHGEVLNVDGMIDAMVARYRRILDHPRLAFRFKIESELHELCDYLKVGFREPDGVYTKRHSHNRVNLGYSDYSAYRRYGHLCDCARELGYSVG